MGLVRKRAGAGSGKKDGNLTEGPIGRGLFRFMITIFLGQLLQQLYNMADAWVVGNFEITTPPPTAIPAKNVITDIFTFDDKLTAAKASLLAKFPTTQASAIL